MYIYESRLSSSISSAPTIAFHEFRITSWTMPYRSYLKQMNPSNRVIPSPNWASAIRRTSAVLPLLAQGSGSCTIQGGEGPAVVRLIFSSARKRPFLPEVDGPSGCFVSRHSDWLNRRFSPSLILREDASHGCGHYVDNRGDSSIGEVSNHNFNQDLGIRVDPIYCKGVCSASNDLQAILLKHHRMGRLLHIPLLKTRPRPT